MGARDRIVRFGAYLRSAWGRQSTISHYVARLLMMPSTFEIANISQYLLGGALLGLGASVLYGSIGRVAGVSGILAGLLRPKAGDWAWRLAFVVGLLAAGALSAALSPSAVRPIPSVASLLVIPAGILVGFGARLGGGCTSGHGICGVSRLSARSIVATITFIVAGAATVLLSRIVGAGA